MARKLRIEYAGARYHVMNRGNYRDWIFETAGARVSFLGCLKEVSESQGWRLHAWCLMSNHYHLLIETQRPNLVTGIVGWRSGFTWGELVRCKVWSVGIVAPRSIRMRIGRS